MLAFTLYGCAILSYWIFTNCLYAGRSETYATMHPQPSRTSLSSVSSSSGSCSRVCSSSCFEACSSPPCLALFRRPFLFLLSFFQFCGSSLVLLRVCSLLLISLISHLSYRLGLLFLPARCCGSYGDTVFLGVCPMAAPLSSYFLPTLSASCSGVVFCTGSSSVSFSSSLVDACYRAVTPSPPALP
jgi:hypothetical protein